MALRNSNYIMICIVYTTAARPRDIQGVPGTFAPTVPKSLTPGGPIPGARSKMIWCLFGFGSHRIAILCTVFFAHTHASFSFQKLSVRPDKLPVERIFDSNSDLIASCQTACNTCYVYSAHECGTATRTFQTHRVEVAVRATWRRFISAPGPPSRVIGLNLKSHEYSTPKTLKV